MQVVMNETWHWPSDLPSSERTQALSTRVADDGNVMGLILTGSWARGMATDLSDLDIYVVLDRSDPKWTPTRSSELDLPVLTVQELATLPEDPNDWWDRYSFAHVRVLLDRLNGRVTRIAAAQGSLRASEANRAIQTFLDGYINFAYRSLKSHRDGRIREAHLDATESIPWVLPVIFAMHRRVRPYNKYLAWELQQHPLGDDRYDNGRLLAMLDSILTTADPEAQRRLFAIVSVDARRHGFGDTVDAWGSELQLFRSR